jgi:hypothetical protein
MSVLTMVETAMQFSQYRAALLAGDAANASSAGFHPTDAALAIEPAAGGLRFAAAMRDVESAGPVSTVEYAMGGIAKNSVWYRALAGQAHAILREFRTVAEEARR